jgi:hypothetical protein
MTTIVNDVSDVGIYNIVADQGTTFIRQIVYKNSAGTAINLGTGATASMKVRKSYPARLNAAAYRDAPVISIGTSDPSVFASTATVTIASPGVFTTASAHNILTNDIVKFTTTGALPTGLTAGTSYYAIYVSATTFNVSSTLSGSAINTSGTQSGTHSLYKTTLDLTPSTGIIDIKIPSTTMAGVAAGIYDYDLEVTLGTSPGVGTVGDTIKIIRGLFEVRQEITY